MLVHILRRKCILCWEEELQIEEMSVFNNNY